MYNERGSGNEDNYKAVHHREDFCNGRVRGQDLFYCGTLCQQIDIALAIKTLYKGDVKKVNTARTIYGKKAFVQFHDTAKARDLATNIGML